MPSHCHRCLALVDDASRPRCPACDTVARSSGWPTDARLGAVVAGGQYRVVRRLGRGGFGTVYLVETVAGGLRRAMKVLHPELASDPAIRARAPRQHVLRAAVSRRGRLRVSVEPSGESASTDTALGTNWSPGAIGTARRRVRTAGVGDGPRHASSEAMVEVATREAVRAGLAHVRFLRQDAEAPVQTDRAFDAALCSLGLMYVPDPTLALRRMREAVRPGGRVVAAVWGARARCGWAEIFPIVDARVQSDVCPMFFQLGTGDTLARAFTAAGFEAVTTERLQVTLSYVSADDALRAAFAGGPVALAYGRFDAATGDSAHAEYLASIEPFREGDGYAIPGEFVVTKGMRPAS